MHVGEPAETFRYNSIATSSTPTHYQHLMDYWEQTMKDDAWMT
jgi:hypothetical protein